MIIVWIRKANSVRRSGETAEERMARHNEDMKRFRESHPDLNIVDARDIVTADGMLLAPVQGVRLHRNTQN